jgi:hypothetical protein
MNPACAGRRRRASAVVLLVVTVVGGMASACGAGEDPRAAVLRERLKQEKELSRAEIVTLFDLVAPVIDGKSVTIRKGAMTTPLDEKQRLEVLGLLGEPTAVYDGGVKVEGDRILRAICAPGTPAMSEIDATQTLWIDTATFVPVRYDFAYSVTGFGDYSYDLSFR